MQKKILISVGILSTLLIALFIYAFIISFKVVKQSTDNINVVLKKNFQSIVRVPEPIPPTLRSFEKTIYSWEMVTREKEVTTVNFIHDTGFSRYQDKITASLEMPQGQDASLFVKVMPAVVADSQALASSQDLEHANLDPNKEVGNNKIELFTKDDSSTQVTQIVWEFDRAKIVAGSEQYYQKLYKYPESILKALYTIQRAILILLSP